MFGIPCLCKTRLTVYSSVLLLAIAAGFVSSNATAQEKKPKRSAFESWNGTWKGEFRAYTADGKVTTTLQVTQKYRMDKDGVQRADFFETDQNGKKTTGKAENIERNDELICIVKKSDGSIAKHKGRALGPHRICWFSDEKDKRESFFESVEKIGGETYYIIRGFGIYGEGRGKAFFFEGRYKKQK